MRGYRKRIAVIGLLAGGQIAAQIPEIGQICRSVCEGIADDLGAQSRIAPLGTPGEPLIIEGIVRDRSGAPAEGIIVYAYHTDDGGLYPPDSSPPGALRGWVRTDAAGRYRFDTIRPAPYPDDDIPAHVHLHIIEADKVTYIVDDIIFSDDPLWPSRWAPDMRSGRGGDGLGDPVRDESGVWRIRNDIVLGENIAGYDAPWID